MTGPELRAALAEQVRHRGGNPESLDARRAVVGLARSSLSEYESGVRPVPEKVRLRLEVQQLRARVAELEALQPAS